MTIKRRNSKRRMSRSKRRISRKRRVSRVNRSKRRVNSKKRVSRSKRRVNSKRRTSRVNRSKKRVSSKRRVSRSKRVNISKTNPYNINNFFDKIYIINLKDKIQRWKKVSSRFDRNNIKYTRFLAVDGRCKTDAECLKKRKTFMNKYNIKMKLGGYPLKELLPASSLTIGTILILREMVKKKWDHVLIAEDDVVIGKQFHTKFKAGIKELEKHVPDWDVIYLGCGSHCGYRGISKSKTRRNKYRSTLSKIYKENIYVEYKDDLRTICDDCPKISKHLSWPSQPGGTWCYGYSLKGAKKMLKIINNQSAEHIDGLLWDAIADEELIGVSFDPPIVWHEKGAVRSDSDIPWEY